MVGRLLPWSVVSGVMVGNVVCVDSGRGTSRLVGCSLWRVLVSRRLVVGESTRLGPRVSSRLVGCVLSESMVPGVVVVAEPADLGGAKSSGLAWRLRPQPCVARVHLLDC